jgi:hypothetical protein
VDSVGIAHNHLHRAGVYDGEAWGRPRDAARYPGPHGNGRYTQDIWWHALNCGLRLTPSAGSASGVLPNPVGYNRAYVHCDGELTWDKWWDGLRAGRVFVTNGPLLRVTANGQLPGAVLRTDGGPLSVDIAGRLDSRDPIAALELIRNGRAERIEFPARVTIDESGRFLVRAIADVENTYRFASTAPWYVEIGGKAAPPQRESAQFFLDWTAERIAQLEKISDKQKREDVLRVWREAELFWKEKAASAVGEARPAKNDADLRAWLESLVWHHRYTPGKCAPCSASMKINSLVGSHVSTSALITHPRVRPTRRYSCCRIRADAIRGSASSKAR